MILGAVGLARQEPQHCQCGSREHHDEQPTPRVAAHSEDKVYEHSGGEQHNQEPMPRSEGTPVDVAIQVPKDHAVMVAWLPATHSTAADPSSHADDRAFAM